MKRRHQMTNAAHRSRSALARITEFRWWTSPRTEPGSTKWPARPASSLMTPAVVQVTLYRFRDTKNTDVSPIGPFRAGPVRPR